MLPRWLALLTLLQEAAPPAASGPAGLQPHSEQHVLQCAAALREMTDPAPGALRPAIFAAIDTPGKVQGMQYDGGCRT